MPLDSRQPCPRGLQILVVPLGGDHLVAKPEHLLMCPVSFLFGGFRPGLDLPELIAQVVDLLVQAMKFSGVLRQQGAVRCSSLSLAARMALRVCSPVTQPPVRTLRVPLSARSYPRKVCIPPSGGRNLHGDLPIVNGHDGSGLDIEQSTTVGLERRSDLPVQCPHPDGSPAIVNTETGTQQSPKSAPQHRLCQQLRTV